MRLLSYLFGTLILLGFTACESFEPPVRETYPEITTLENTVWHQHSNIPTFCDISFEVGERGEMIKYTDDTQTEVVSTRPFSYTFTPANGEVDTIVTVNFDDGLNYGGMLIHKGQANILINDAYVYWIQLYEVDSEGAIIYDENGKIKSSILMWKE